MPATQADIDALNQAIRDGVRSVQIGGQTVIYQTTESLIKARNDAQDEFNAEQQRATGRRVPTVTYLYQSGRGYR